MVWVNAQGNPVAIKTVTMAFDLPQEEAVGASIAKVNWGGVLGAAIQLIIALMSGNTAGIAAAMQALINAIIAGAVVLGLGLALASPAEAQSRRKAAGGCADGSCGIPQAAQVQSTPQEFTKLFDKPSRPVQVVQPAVQVQTEVPIAVGIFPRLRERLESRPRLLGRRGGCG